VALKKLWKRAAPCWHPTKPPFTTKTASAGEDFGLASLLGVHFTGKYTENELNAYIAVHDGVGDPHPGPGLRRRGRMAGTENRVGIAFDTADLSLLPIGPYPPSRTCPWKRFIPGMCRQTTRKCSNRRVGKGRVVFFEGISGAATGIICWWITGA
jgi:hypothetical protein